MFSSNATHPVMKRFIHIDSDCGQKNIAHVEYEILLKSSRSFFEG